MPGDTLEEWQAWARETVSEHPDTLLPLMPLIDPDVDEAL